MLTKTAPVESFAVSPGKGTLMLENLPSRHGVSPRSAFTAAVAVALAGVTQPGTAWGGDKAIDARHGMVVSVSAPASEVGVAILKKGGNAVDAAVATAFALAVTYPPAGNIGGGGFMVIHPGANAEPVVIDYRECAPAAAT